jgi:hypothetical protein
METGLYPARTKGGGKSKKSKMVAGMNLKKG